MVQGTSKDFSEEGYISQLSLAEQECPRRAGRGRHRQQEQRYRRGARSRGRHGAPWARGARGNQWSVTLLWRIHTKARWHPNCSEGSSFLNSNRVSERSRPQTQNLSFPRERFCLLYREGFCATLFDLKNFKIYFSRRDEKQLKSFPHRNDRNTVVS